MMHSESGHDRYICGQWIGKRAKQALPSALMQDRLDARLSSEGCGAQHCERSKWAELPMVLPVAQSASQHPLYVYGCGMMPARGYSYDLFICGRLASVRCRRLPRSHTKTARVERRPGAGRRRFEGPRQTSGSLPGVTSSRLLATVKIRCAIDLGVWSCRGFSVMEISGDVDATAHHLWELDHLEHAVTEVVAPG
jgi:hypothetical protein